MFEVIAQSSYNLWTSMQMPDIGDAPYTDDMISQLTDFLNNDVDINLSFITDQIL